jgi:vacuolar-type H+-ATPase subunit I/STV1
MLIKTNTEIKKMKLKDLKLTKDVHSHLEEMGLVTFDDLKKAVEFQRASIPEDAACQLGCSDCEDVLLEIWKVEELV